MHIPKLLAPVRNETSLTSAIKAGADAVYFGVGELNMRVSSRGIEPHELPRLVKFAHKNGVEVFITLNSIIYDEEITKLKKILTVIKKSQADAVICHDMAVITLCREMKIPIHLSTQANISNTKSAQYYEKLGAKCVVLARECTLAQIAKIKKNVKCKVEIFGHGAMCVSVSGRCFLSEFLNCKSANRGECTQPCRREYTIKDNEEYGNELLVGGGYVMSPKDLCTIRILDKIAKTKIDYLKIEGRSRSPEYIATVTQTYRTALDALKNKKYTPELCDELILDLQKVYNRGFSEGFLFGRPASEGWVRGRDNQATERKEFVGKISHYYPKAGVAELFCQAGKLKTGEEIYIQGPTTGSLRLKIEKLEKHENNLATFPCAEYVRLNDEVYKIVKIK